MPFLVNVLVETLKYHMNHKLIPCSDPSAIIAMPI